MLPTFWRDAAWLMVLPYKFRSETPADVDIQFAQQQVGLFAHNQELKKIIANYSDDATWKSELQQDSYETEDFAHISYKELFPNTVKKEIVLPKNQEEFVRTQAENVGLLAEEIAELKTELGVYVEIVRS